MSLRVDGNAGKGVRYEVSGDELRRINIMLSLEEYGALVRMAGGPRRISNWVRTMIRHEVSARNDEAESITSLVNEVRELRSQVTALSQK